jgi:hypothetical protein
MKKCTADMDPVWAQLHQLTPEQRSQANLDPDHLARRMLPCQKQILSDACVDAQASLAEKLDAIFGTSNGAAVLMDCTQATKDYQMVFDLLRTS